jgi:hypothetical protein
VVGGGEEARQQPHALAEGKVERVARAQEGDHRRAVASDEEADGLRAAVEGAGPASQT